jgi:hypothetical protein
MMPKNMCLFILIIENLREVQGRVKKQFYVEMPLKKKERRCK